MSKEILHILNGDSTKTKFDEASFLGQCMVWREVLVQGPLFYLIDSELFWDMRSQFMERAFNAKLAGYRRKVIQEFAKLRKYQGKEIVLWFEYDLFCQVNFMALISYILKNKRNCKLSMVCVGEYPGVNRLVGLSEIATSDYKKLFEERMHLNRSDMLIADRAWMLFCGRQLDKFEEIRSDKFIYLQDALQASLKTFSEPGAYSELEKAIIQLRDVEKLTKKEIITHLLENDHNLGFGDLQYEYILRELEGK